MERIVGIMSRAGMTEIIVVAGFEHERVSRTEGIGKARIVVNDRWREGQLSSLRAAVRSLSTESEGILFTPVDHPLVQAATYEAIIGKWNRNPDRIVIPRHGGRKGHPAIFPSRLYGPLLYDELPGGARDLIYREMKSVLFVPVPDPGVIQDIDTIEDYRQLIGEMP